jgi:CRISPR-associated protein Cmr2
MGHLLAIAIGPVQEFIRAARRTRDLWFGSYLLSEISKAAAQAVQEKGGRLIFPPAGSDLNPDSSLNVANVVLAELPSGDPKEVASHAKKATQQRWQQFAEEAYCLAQGVIREEVWRDQVNDVLEFYAAWVRQDEDYPATRARLMRLLAGRKNCRDFLPAKGRAGVPKSSLDGQRETVLKDPSVEPWPEDIRRTFRLSGGEQLDVIGVVKRIAGGQRPYPSISRVAADPWIRGHQAEPEFQELCQVCRTLAQQGALYRLNTKDYPQYKSFPYEGTALFPSRHHEWE